jgi:adhesin transport system outer membrane protein
MRCVTIALFVPVLLLSAAADVRAQTPANTPANAVEQLVRSAAEYESFRAAISDAVNKHPRLGEAISAQREAQQQIYEARAGLLPTLDAGLNFDHSISRSFDGDRNLNEAFRPKERIDAQVTGSQLLTDFGATRHRVKSAGARASAAEEEARLAAEQVTLDAVAAWDDLALAQTLVALADAFVVRHQQILLDTQVRFDQGVGPRSDVARVEAYLANIEGQVARFRRDLASARARYQESFATAPPETILRAPVMQSQASTLEEALALAQKNNPLMARAAKLTNSADEDYAAAKADRLPRLSLQVDATRFDAFDNNADFDVRGRIVSRYPLFSGGLRSARAAQALQRLKSAEAAQTRTQSEIERDVAIAFEDVAALQAQRDTLQRAYAANQRALGFFIEQFKVARGTLLDLLQAEQDAFEASVAYARGQTELTYAKNILLTRTGELLPSYGVSLSFTDAKSLWGF